VETSLSLLVRLRQPYEAAAWERFVALYTPLMLEWSRRLGLDTSAANDLVQEVFVVLLKKLPEFRYRTGGHFRGWLQTVLRNKHHELRRKRQPDLMDEAVLDAQAAEAAAVEVLGEQEYRQHLMARALELMRAEFPPATWQAFWELVVNNRSGAEVAAGLGSTPNAVYLARARVVRRLRQELAGLFE
jgi:RNA polymerase sigma-70 factor (ECF subfamily)